MTRWYLIATKDVDGARWEFHGGSLLFAHSAESAVSNFLRHNREIHGYKKIAVHEVVGMSVFDVPDPVDSGYEASPSLPRCDTLIYPAASLDEYHENLPTRLEREPIR